MMPALLMGLFGSLIGWLGQWFTKKVAIGIAASAAFVAMTVGMWAICFGGIAALKATLPDVVQLAAAQVIPSNVPACISAYISARMAKTFYDWNVENLKIMAYIT